VFFIGAFLERFEFLFFSLDRKEPKDQGCTEKAKNFLAGRTEK
jgi:hypothetical protein